MPTHAKAVSSESQLDGYVVGVEGPFVRVRCNGHAEVRARRATSCLVTPELGDRVLLATLVSGESFVIAVLVREETEGPLRLGADRDLVIESTGRVDVAAPDGVGLYSTAAVKLAGKVLEIDAEDGRIKITSLLYLGAKVVAHATRSTLVSDICETIADTLSQNVKRAHRVVAELDQLRAGNVDYAAKQGMRVHAQTTFLTAEGVVKLDGENIHLG